MGATTRFARLSGVMATIALLIGATVAAWVWGGDGSDPSNLRSDQVQGDPRRPNVPAPAPPLVQPKGTVVLDTTAKFSAIEEAKVIGEGEAVVLRPQVGTVTMLVTTQNTTTTGTWLFTVLPGHKLSDLLSSINQLYTDAGFKPLVGAQAGTTVMVSRPADGEPGNVVYRAHYISTHGVVRVEAYGPGATQVDEAFATLFTAQLTNTPPVG